MVLRSQSNGHGQQMPAKQTQTDRPDIHRRQTNNYRQDGITTEKIGSGGREKKFVTEKEEEN